MELPGDSRAAFVFPRMFGEALTPPMAADLVTIARDWGPDLLVHEQAELAAPLVGALCSIPSVTHSFGTAVPKDILDDTRQRLAGLWREHGLDVPPYAGCFRAGYLDICPPSVQTTPVDHIGVVQPLRPVTVSASSAEDRRNPSSTSRWARCTTVPTCCGRSWQGWRVSPSAPWWRSGRVSTRPRWGSSPGTSGWSHGSTRPRCWTSARRWSRTVAPAPSSERWRAACPSSASRRPPTSSAMPRAGSAPERRSSLGPAGVTAASVRDAGERLLADAGLRESALRVAAEIAEDARPRAGGGHPREEDWSTSRPAPPASRGRRTGPGRRW